MIKRVINRLLRPYRRWKSIRVERAQIEDRAMNYARNALSPYLDYSHGTFIELGANDGIRQSNTLWLEREKQWHGVLIEPVPRLFNLAKRNRPKAEVFNFACVSSDYEAETITITDVGLMSVVEGAMNLQLERTNHIRKGAEIQQLSNTPNIEVRATTLTAILNMSKFDDFDLLSLDVEGYEASVLRGLDFNIYRPKFIFVETHHDKDGSIHKILDPYYELVEKVDAANALYRSKN